VLISAIIQGLKSKDYFGYAGSISEEGKYRGFVFGDPLPQVQINETCILIKMEAAKEEDKKYEEPKTEKPGEVKKEGGVEVVDVRLTKKPEIKVKKRYFASTELDPIRFKALAGQIGEND